MTASDGRNSATIDLGSRGLPPGIGNIRIVDIVGERWHPANGQMSLPILSINVDEFRSNAAVMVRIAQEHNALLAPHAKTPMSPELTRELLNLGAWAASVADLRQAEVMLAGGIKRLIIANQIGGSKAIERLAQLLLVYTDAEIFLFVDNIATFNDLQCVWKKNDKLPILKIFLEMSCGRGGFLTTDEILPILNASAERNGEKIEIVGISVYEGTLSRSDENETIAEIAILFEKVAESIAKIRLYYPDKLLFISAGGSSYFDQVIRNYVELFKDEKKLQLVIRSGACYFSDHGAISGRLDRLFQRVSMFDIKTNPFRPVLRIWAEVLSANKYGTAICGLGLRDTSYDQGLPVPLRQWRNGKVIASLPGQATVTKLNDQHAFLNYSSEKMIAGDVIEFGISHPCTCFDKHSVVYGVNTQGNVITAFLTNFG